MLAEDWMLDWTASQTSLKLVGASMHGVMVAATLVQSVRSMGITVAGRTVASLISVDKTTYILI